MKNSRTLFAAIALAASVQVSAHAGQPLTLFGTPLRGATRTELRAALQKAGLIQERVDDGYFCDKYGVNGQIKGAKGLTVCYSEGDNVFAAATYSFPAFMDTGLVKRVVDMVKTKYGSPSSFQGMYDLGDVTARWDQPQGMEVEVTRGWPDTTTYLTLEDRANWARMNTQIKRDQAQRIRQQAAHDGRAF